MYVAIVERQAEAFMQGEKQMRRLVREYAGKAHELDLRASLTQLAEDVRAWERGELDSFELESRLHRFHQDDAREIYKRYATNHLEPVVAAAIAAGVLPRESVPPPLLEYLSGLIGMFESS